MGAALLTSSLAVAIGSTVTLWLVLVFLLTACGAYGLKALALGRRTPAG